MVNYNSNFDPLFCYINGQPVTISKYTIDIIFSWYLMVDHEKNMVDLKTPWCPFDYFLEYFVFLNILMKLNSYV